MMQKLSAPVLCMAVVVLYVAASPSPSENVLKSKATITAHKKDGKKILERWREMLNTVWFAGACRAVCSRGTVFGGGDKADFPWSEAGEGYDGKEGGEAQTPDGGPETWQQQKDGLFFVFFTFEDSLHTMKTWFLMKNPFTKFAFLQIHVSFSFSETHYILK